MPVGKPGVPTVAVIAWDVGHNPLGRAYLLAEALDRRYNVALIGFQFPRYGDAAALRWLLAVSSCSRAKAGPPRPTPAMHARFGL